MQRYGPTENNGTLPNRASRPRSMRRVVLFAAAALLLSLPAAHAAEKSFAFTVQITLSPKAAATLAKLSEGIVASATYAGEPVPAAIQHADQIGQIDLGTETVESSGKAGTVQITGTKVKRARIAWIKGPVLLNVNVYSARRSGPDNILACDFFDGTLQQAVRQPISLHCSLITENVPTQHKF